MHLNFNIFTHVSQHQVPHSSLSNFDKLLHASQNNLCWTPFQTCKVEHMSLDLLKLQRNTRAVAAVCFNLVQLSETRKHLILILHQVVGFNACLIWRAFSLGGPTTDQRRILLLVNHQEWWGANWSYPNVRSPCKSFGWIVSTRLFGVGVVSCHWHWQIAWQVVH